MYTQNTWIRRLYLDKKVSVIRTIGNNLHICDTIKNKCARSHQALSRKLAAPVTTHEDTKPPRCLQKDPMQTARTYSKTHARNRIFDIFAPGKQRTDPHSRDAYPLQPNICCAQSQLHLTPPNPRLQPRRQQTRNAICVQKV